ncbi:hypothetical protein IFM89_039728 [Coptis chinensis]|uniref:H15 domain-containing protein n=1 Tax=Coptis chinensis TaxID=261450 RepID=A0A835GVR6_9MAGN|nr:hypothetical protein IFM89_039728 [Coptis chinensis]
MATEEVNKPPSLPPYSEMIFAAIDSLNDKNGSNRSAISTYIESTYGDLPEAHFNIMTEHLNKLKDSGEVVFLKNNYMRPNPNAPPKRGRGRPPKPKTGSSSSSSTPPADAYTGPPRARGRPPKPKDPLSVAAAPMKAAAAAGRGRGRPPKKESGDEETMITTTTVSAVTGPPRARGRPPKAKTEVPVV